MINSPVKTTINLEGPILMGFFVTRTREGENENKGAGVLDLYVEHFIFIFYKKDRKSGPTRKILVSKLMYISHRVHIQTRLISCRINKFLYIFPVK